MHDQQSMMRTMLHSGPRHRARRTAGLARACGAALLATGWLCAHAQPPQAGAAAAAAPREFAVAAGTAPAPALPALPFLPSPHGAATRAIGDDRLAELRGGTDTPWSDMKLGGTVGNNAATNVVTGANIITDGAFSNASGLPMVIQNSGANVLIQNATIVNLQMR